MNVDNRIYYTSAITQACGNTLATSFPHFYCVHSEMSSFQSQSTDAGHYSITLNSNIHSNVWGNPPGFTQVDNFCLPLDGEIFCQLFY